MAFWENIKTADKILDVILSMDKLHKKINKEISNTLNKEINLKTRIWIHYWKVIVWDVWNFSWKISYTIIWDNVNLASRLEWVNKFYSTNIIVSEEIINKIKNRSFYKYRLIDKIAVKWKTKWIKIYQLLSNEDNINDLMYIRKFEKWIYYYITWIFDSAFAIFSELKNSEIWKKDKVLDIMLERVKNLKNNPPEIWEWIWKYYKK